MENRKELISYLQNISLFVLGITLLIFPLAVSTITTDAFSLPKEIVLGVSVLALFLIFAIKTLVEKKVSLRRTPFDLPVVLFIVAVFLSSIFAVNRFDSLIEFVPFLFSSLLYFVIVNIAKEKSSTAFLSASFVTGAVVLSAITILSFLKIYPLPFAFTHAQTFTPLGSQLDQAAYLIISLGFVTALAWPLIKKLTSRRVSAFEKEKIELFDGGFLLGALVVLLGAVVTLYALVKLQNPVVLPFETGFQTAFAEISQDTGRVAQGFLFGSGFGTYGVDFSRFKSISFNQNQNLWSLTFIRSSSYVLELLATAGILGIAAFAFLLYKLFKEKAYSDAGLILAIITSFVLPFSFATQTLLFIVLGLYAARAGLKEKNQHKYFDVELHFVTLKKGILSLTSNISGRTENRFLPIIFFIIVALLVAIIGFFSGQFALSDLTFQKSLVAASANNGSQTYALQSKAINSFPQRALYYRYFSQTNLALATSLTSSLPKNSSPSAQTQQTILTLTQQSINAARQATVLSPQTSLYWGNLSSIYRSLIGFGQNAESFAISSAQQAAALDPNNPNEYINLGGIYYQLGQWDNAQQQFQIAVNLKPDLANAYYNLGHALEQKGDLKGALAQYQTVKNLVASDKTNLDTISKEIDALQKKISSGTGATNQTGTPTQLPPQNPPIQIPSPPATSSAK